jgi:hypothetical protein
VPRLPVQTDQPGDQKFGPLFARASLPEGLVQQ